MSQDGIDALRKGDQNQQGDPEKAVQITIDLVRKEGCAAGKIIPLRFPLGSDCTKVIKEKCEETLKLLEDWEDVMTSTDIQE